MNNLEYLEHYRDECKKSFYVAKKLYFSDPTFEHRKAYFHYADTLDKLETKITKIKQPPNYEFIKKLRGVFDDDISYTPLPF